jgi:hypothetical protein
MWDVRYGREKLTAVKMPIVVPVVKLLKMGYQMAKPF